MPRYRQIAEQIQEMIAAGSLRRGDKIPAERMLAENFKVSRNCVREAIRALAQKGVLESRQGDGTYVCAPDDETLRQSFVEAFSIQRGRLREIFEFRLALEPVIAALAARNASGRDLDELKILACDQQRLLLAGECDDRLDLAFHQRLALACGNRLMSDVMLAMSNALSECRSEFLQSPERRRASAEGHLRLIGALEAGSGAAAREIMAGHIREVWSWALDEDGPHGPAEPDRPAPAGSQTTIQKQECSC